MKKLTLLFLLIGITANAQVINATTEDGKSVLLNSNGTWEYIDGEKVERKMGLPEFNGTSFLWEGGNEELYEVKFTNGLKEELDKKIFDKVIMTMMVKSKYVLKNKYSFVPKKLMLYKGKSGYSGSTEFLGKNAYGAEGLSTAFFSFDLEGNVELLFSK